ncbi:uncharacterized protein LOC114357436 isoform X1 [Ostrinia furnacalis]|uniref:uncharacterized protein LOC114357436 isoform X1 n=1 Tax=Ostrinia furnacalis TaxID=93504 RepID=UPI00103E350F|nr:uncharacterized protein LOC114357436 isoform X1 [Ostrinia furnacalis]
MPKRKYEGESKEDRYARKLRKYEEKLKERRRKNRPRILYSSDEDLNGEDDREISIPPPEESEIFPECSLQGENTSQAGEPVVNAAENTTSTTRAEGTDVVPVCDIEPELLKALGDFEPETVEWGDNVQEDIAKRFQHLLSHGLQKEAKEQLTKKYLFAKNISFAKAPTLNPEIATMLTESFRNRDKRMLNKQEQLGRALSSLSAAMTALLKKNPDLSEVMSILNDTGKLLADSHFTETESRRAMIGPLVDKSFMELFKDRKRDTMLFGEKLGDLVKNSRGISRTGQYIQSTVSNMSGSNLNGRGQPLRSRPPQRATPNYQYRTGGQRNQYATRRRAPVPAHTNARRQAAAPPPPARRQPPSATRPPPPTSGRTNT